MDLHGLYTASFFGEVERAWSMIGRSTVRPVVRIGGRRYELKNREELWEKLVEIAGNIVRGREPGYSEAVSMVRAVESVFDPSLGVRVSPMLVAVMILWYAAAVKALSEGIIEEYNPFTGEQVWVRAGGERSRRRSVRVWAPGSGAGIDLRVDLRDGRGYIRGPRPRGIGLEAEECLRTGRMRLLSLLGYEAWRSSPCRCLALETGSRNPYRVRLALYTRLAIAIAVHNALLLGRLSSDADSPVSVFYARGIILLPSPGPYLAVDPGTCSSSRRIRQSRHCKGAILPGFFRVYQSARAFAERCLSKPLTAAYPGITLAPPG